MSSIENILLPNESVIVTSRPHWFIYHQGALLFAKGSALLALYLEYAPTARLLLAGLLVVYAMAAVAFLRAWFRRWITLYAVTTIRVVHMKQFISTEIVEMNLSQVESAKAEQSALGRVFGFGTVHVEGAGHGSVVLPNISSPLEVESAILANARMVPMPHAA